jgi:hypothetical protein
MEEKEIIQKLSEFKKVKPDSDWAIWLKANILETKPAFIKPRVKLAAFSFIPKYQKILVPSLLAFFFVFTFAFAQTSLPGDVLYPIKTLTQNAKIYFASENTKPIVRLEVAKARMEDLSKVQNHEKEISAIFQNVQKDLEIVPQEIKKIDKKEVALDVSKKVQEKSKDLQVIADKIPLRENDKQELTKTVENTQSQVLALIIETTDQINQCPSYLQTNLNNLQQYLVDNKDMIQFWPGDDFNKIKVYVSEISNYLKAGNCLEAMEKMESINQILQIHSLETSSSTLDVGGVQVETSTSSSGE